MTFGSRPRDLVVASFLALGVGFAAGWWMGRESTPGAVAPPSTMGEAPHPVGAQEYLQLGMQALGAGDYAEAERRFRRAVELQPEEAAPHADLAVALMYQERWEEAQGELDLARRYDPGMPEVWFLEGVVHRDGRGDMARARESWERFLTMVPTDTPQARTVREWLAEMDGGVPADTASTSSGGVATPSGGR
ncbi:MAG TPA: tetratricopeptide repeat protein [Gemmatimonadota bacterium]|nr:tetratricopeptide repeat protein [Gemmatimonadota bacterium]